MNRRQIIIGGAAVAAAGALPAAPVYPMSVGITRDYIDSFRIGDVHRMVFEDPLTLQRYRIPMRVTSRHRWDDGRRWGFSIESCGPRIEVPEHTAVWILDIRRTALWVPR